MMVRLLLKQRKMMNTEFIMRNQCAEADRVLRKTKIQLRLVDGGIILAFVSAFLGLLLILSK